MKIIILFLFIIISFQNLYADEFNLQKINEPYKSDFYTKITREGNIFYALGLRAFHILETDSQGYLYQINELPLYGSLSGGLIWEINNNYAYIGAYTYNYSEGQILYRVNIEDNNPVLTDSLFFPYPATFVTVFKSNDYSFVQVEDYSTILYIYDNETFELLAQYDVDNDFGCMSFNKINENYVFGPDHDNHSFLHIYNITDIYNIEYIGDIDFTGSNVELGWLRSYNDSISVFCGYFQYTFLDISDITNWEIKSQMEFPENNMALHNFAKLSDNRMVIPRGLSQDLYDMSDITNPVLLDTIDISFYANSSIGFGDYYYGANFNMGIEEFKVENNEMIWNGRFPEFTTLDHAFKHQDYLIIQTFYTNGIHFFDVSDIYNSQYICTHFEDYFTYGIDFRDSLMAVSTGDPPYSDPNYTTDVYDISDIENPVLRNQLQDKGVWFIHLVDNAFYTLEYQQDELDHLVKYDITESGIPDIIFDFILPEPIMHGFAIYNNYAYYRGEDIIYVIKDISNNNPQIVNNFYVGEGIAIRVEDNYLFVFYHDECKVKFYNLEDPESPFCEYEIDFDSDFFFHGLGLHNDLLFAGIYDINIYDLNSCSYYIQDPIYTFQNNFRLQRMIFFEENNNNYFYYSGQTAVALYEYEYNNAAVDDGMFGDDILSFTSYPNPFSTSTTISFNITTESTENTEIKIYNVKGQLVRELLPFAPSPGLPVSVTWDGRNETGKEVKSGVYFCTFQSGEEQYVQKVVLMR